MKKKDLQVLKSMEPCEQGFRFAMKCKEFRMVWEKCERSDWMVWLLEKLDFKDDNKFRLYACKCVRETTLSDGRKVWDLLTDERSRNAVEVAERFAEGNATEEERASASYAASYAAAYASYAASSASYAAYAAASSASYAASSASAYAAASSASYAAAYASYAASYAAAYASYAASYAAARKEQCGILRSFISWDEIEPFYKDYAEGVK